MIRSARGETDWEDLFLPFQHIKMRTHIDGQIDRFDISNEYRRLYLERDTVGGEKWFLFKKYIEGWGETGKN